MKRQIAVLARGYLPLGGFIGQPPANGTMRPDLHCGIGVLADAGLTKEQYLKLKASLNKIRRK